MAANTQLTLEFVTQRLSQFLGDIRASERALTNHARKATAMAGSIAKAGTAATQTQKDALVAMEKTLQADLRSRGKRLQTTKEVAGALAQLLGTQGQVRLSTQQLAAMYEVLGLGAKKVTQGTQQAAKASTNFLQALTALLPGGNKILSLAGRLSAVFGGGRGGIGGGFVALAGGARMAGGAFRALLSPITLVTNAFGKLFSWERIISVATGVLLRDAIFGVMRAMREATSAVLDYAASLQTLQVRYENLIARELRAADSTLSVANSLKQAAPQAQALLEWVKRLSLVAPIDAKDIANTLAYAQAMGFATPQAKSLTETILTFVSAMGLGSDVAERIIFNFGQMIQAGKLTQTELRDLARGALFPLQDVLDEVAKGMGITGKGLVQLREDAAAGKFDIQSFFKAFETVVKRDFPGALERMGQTFQGAMVRMKNAIKVFGGDIFGPVIAQIGRGISAIADTLTDPKIRFGMQVIGETLLRGFKLVWETISSQLIPALKNLAGAFGLVEPSANGFAQTVAKVSAYLSAFVAILADVINWIADNFVPVIVQLTKQMFQWGAGLITSFARGMAAGLTAIVQVISAIGRMISSMFSTHSPPNIAPLIAKWGAEAMTEYIKGWLKGDFSLFNSIADKIEAFLRSIPGGIGKDNLGLVPRILGTRKAIVDAINGIRSGMLSVTQAIDMVIRAAKSVTAEFRTYITALLNVEAAQRLVEQASDRVADAQDAVEAASQRVREAQEEVNEIQEHYSDILDELNSQLEEVTDVYDDQIRLAEINAAINSGLLTDEERRRLEMEKRAIEIRAQIRATEEQRDAEVDAAEEIVDAREAEEAAAQAALDLAQEQLDAAQEQLEVAQEQLETAEALIDFQIRQNTLLQEQMALLEQLARAASGAGAALTDALDIPQIEIPEIEPIDLSGIQEQVDAFFLDIEVKAWLWYANMKYIFDTLFKPLEDSLSEAKTNWGQAWIDMQTNPAVAQTISDIEKAAGIIGQAFTDMKTSVSESSEIIMGVLDDINIEFPSTQAIIELFTGKISELFMQAAGIAVLEMAIITSAFETVATFLTDLDTDLTNLKTSWDNLWSDLTAENLGSLIGDVWTIWRKYFNPTGLLLSMISDFVNGVVTFIKNLQTELVTQSIIPEMMQSIFDIISGKLDETETDWAVSWEVMRVYFNDIFRPAIDENVRSTMASIDSWMMLYLMAIRGKWETDWRAMMNLLTTDVMPAIRELVEKYLTPLSNYIEDPLSPNIKALTDEILKSLADFIDNTLDATLSGLVTGMDAVGRAVDRLATKISNLISKLERLNEVTPNEYIKDSPVPLAEGLKEINKQAIDLAGAGISQLTSAIKSLPAMMNDSIPQILPYVMAQSVAAPAVVGGSVDKSIHIEVNPTYKNMQSETQIYHDVVAALGAAVFR